MMEKLEQATQVDGGHIADVQRLNLSYASKFYGYIAPIITALLLKAAQAKTPGFNSSDSALVWVIVATILSPLDSWMTTSESTPSC